MFGLWITKDSPSVQQEICALLDRQMIPLEGFVDATAFADDGSREDFLRRAAGAILRGEALSAGGVLRHLSGQEALPGNVIRKYVLLQLSLLPTLRINARVTDLPGCFLLGDDLLVAPLGEDGRVDASLPHGVWTELATGECMQGTLRRIRGVNAMPVLARENSVIAIGVDDRRTDADDADRVTLHWFQPGSEAGITLADGTCYTLRRTESGFAAESDSIKPWHVIVHQDGEEMLLR